MLATKFDLPRLKMLCYNIVHNDPVSLPDSTLAIDAVICKENADELSDLTILVDNGNNIVEFKVHMNKYGKHYFFNYIVKIILKLKFMRMYL